MEITKSHIEKREITKELSESYLDYAMSVIISRALPDVRDGLKPVQRRILWAMWETGLKASIKYRKSAAVVGEVLKSYHPHGDLSVYDAMARMAQDFSLRYPLIDGQGNWGCFTKDTKVKLIDGRSLNFGELIKEYKTGKKNYTYTFNNQTNQIEIAEIINPRLTKKSAKIMKVILDNGQEIKCTLNHRFMLRDGQYKEAQDLKPRDSLMPVYERISTKEDDLNVVDYSMIYQPQKNVWEFTHYLSDKWNLENKIYNRNAGRVRHHIDFNKFNNNPENIKRMQWKDHWMLHADMASWRHKNDSEYVKKLAEGRQKFIDNNKGVFSQRAKNLNKKLWQSQEFIKNHSERIRQMWQNEAYRKYMAGMSSRNLKNLWQRKSFQELMSKLKSQEMKERWQNEIYQNYWHKKAREISLKIWSNPKHREYISKIGKQRWQNPEFREKMSQWMKEWHKNRKAEILVSNYNNHKVLKVEFINKIADVYDLTINGTHNFALDAGIFVHNSIDGDNQAAMRYTECRLSKISEELLFDIEKETVNWQANYDGATQEPKVLPAKLPNLLLNGASGIAVGMATSIPPHNLTEIVDAVLHLTENPKATTEDLLNFVKGPDFPTGGIIYDKKAILEAYSTGRGSITTRALCEIQERKSGQFNIIITEIPYQVNKSELIIKIANLAQEKKIEGIRDLRDESDREGMRIVIELKSDANSQKILNQLYKHTDLQKNFNLNMIALTMGGLQPQILSLKEILELYIEHRKEVVRRRAEFDLRKAKERAHILEGLAKALSVIDKIIETIKKSKDREEAHKNLVSKFKFTDIQTSAILDMRLATLAALEKEKIENELEEKRKLIKELETLLASNQKILKVIKDELAAIKEKYGDERRTKVVAGGLKEFKEEDLIPSEDAVIILTADGYIKRLPPTTFKAQRRGGKGLIGSEVNEEDVLAHFISSNTHDNILFFTDKGKVFQTKVYEIPVGSRTAKGKLMQNFLEIPNDENISAIVSYGKENKGQNFLVMATKNGIIKKTSLEDFANIRRNGLIAVNLKDNDLLKWAKISSGKDEIIITTAAGQAIRFKESQLRPMGRTAAGVKAIRLKKGDIVAGVDIIPTDNKEQLAKLKLLVVMESGFSKQTPLKEYKAQSRGGSGIKTAKIAPKTGKIVAAQIISDEEELLALSTKGQIIRTKISNIRVAGRATSGVKIMSLYEGDKVAGIVVL